MLHPTGHMRRRRTLLHSWVCSSEPFPELVSADAHK